MAKADDNVISWAERTRKTPPMKVATLNVKNLDPSDGEQFDKLAKYIVSSQKLRSPHVLALQEVQDDNGPKDDSVTNADKTLAKLARAIKRAGGPDYDFVDVDPQNDRDGGQPGGNIRNAFLFDPSRVHLHPAPDGDYNDEAKLKKGQDGRVHLDINPGRIAPDFEAFKHSRKPLVAEFVDNISGESLFVTNIHLASKRGGPWTEKIRARQSEAIADFEVKLINELEANGQDCNVMIVGDFNSEETEQPVKTLTQEDGMFLADDLRDGNYYTYIYRGRKQAIDHVVTHEDIAEEHSAHSVPGNAEERKHSASDHNGVLIQVDFDRGREGKAKADQVDESRRAAESRGR